MSFLHSITKTPIICSVAEWGVMKKYETYIISHGANMTGFSELWHGIHTNSTLLFFLTFIGCFFGILGYFKVIKNNTGDNPYEDLSRASIKDGKLIIDLSGDNITQHTTIKEIPFLDGYIIFRVDYWPSGGEIYDFITFILVLLSSLVCMLLFLLLTSLFPNSTLIIALLLFIIFSLTVAAGVFLGGKNFIIINLDNRNTYHLNRIFFSKLKDVNFSIHAHQYSLEKWIPMLFINDLVIEKHEYVDSEQAAYEKLKNKAITLARILNKSYVETTVYEMTEFSKKTVKIIQKVALVFKMLNPLSLFNKKIS